MSGFLLRPVSLVNDAFSFSRTSVSTANGTVDGVVPSALPDTNFIDKARWDETIRALEPIALSVSPQSGTTDDLTTVNSTPTPVEGDKICIWGTTGNIINVRHLTGGGNIRLSITDPTISNVISLVGQYSNISLCYRGGSWCETSRSIIPS